MKGLFIIAAFIAVAHCQQIDIPPTNTSVVAGSNVNLTCQVSGDVSMNRLSWREHIEDPIGVLIFNSAMDGPNDEEEFEIHGKYALMIKEANTNDGGVYSCGLDGQSPYKINVQIIERPGIKIPELYEGQTQPIECHVAYGAAPPAFANPNQTPRIQARIDTDIVEGIETRTTGLLGEASTISYVVNVTTTKLDHLRTFSCEVIVDEPAFKIGDRKIMNVVHEVHSVEITPQRKEFYVGEKIACGANGYPEPSYRWMPVVSPGTRQVSGNVLEIQENMIGQNEWKCEATNDAGNGIEEESMEIEFIVLPATEPPYSSACLTQTSGLVMTISYLISKFL